MPDNFGSTEKDARRSTARIKELLSETVEYARSHATEVGDPKAQALFETTAEVLLGLRKAYEDFEMKNEAAWRKAS